MRAHLCDVMAFCPAHVGVARSDRTEDAAVFVRSDEAR